MQINNQFSSIRGKINMLMVAVTDIDGQDQFERVFALLQTLQPHTCLLVWCNSQAVQAQVNAWLRQQGITAERRLSNQQVPVGARCVLLAPASEYTLAQYSHWVRDPFLAHWNEYGKLTFWGSAAAKVEDSMWIPLALKHLKIEGLSLVESPSGAIPVAGGNILFDEDFIMVGARQFRERGVPDNGERLLSLLNGNGGRRQFSRLIEIGKDVDQEPPRLVHIDLYLSLTGQREAGQYVVLVGKCELVTPGVPPSPGLVQTIDRMNEYLEAVAGQLHHEGFCVHRNPLPVLQKKGAAESYLCSYNNCLTEVTNELNPVVWLAKLTHQQESAPHFQHLQQLEQANIAAWENLGFEVRLVTANFHSILDDQGSLHCITNELLRY